MKIDIPKIIRVVELADYAEELKPARVFVWVNPTKDVLEAYSALFERSQKANSDLAAAKPDDIETIKTLMAEMARVGDGFAEWYSQIWSQGIDPETHLAADTVRQLAMLETDPAFYQWLTRQSWELINQHRSTAKKK